MRFATRRDLGDEDLPRASLQAQVDQGPEGVLEPGPKPGVKRPLGLQNREEVRGLGEVEGGNP